MQSKPPTSEIYSDAIQRLLQLSMRDYLALLCAEGDPANCHRQHVIAQTLLASGASVIHILKNGELTKAWREDKETEQPELF